MAACIGGSSSSSSCSSGLRGLFRCRQAGEGGQEDLAICAVVVGAVPGCGACALPGADGGMEEGFAIGQGALSAVRGAELADALEDAGGDEDVIQSIGVLRQLHRPPPVWG